LASARFDYISTDVSLSARQSKSINDARARARDEVGLPSEYTESNAFLVHKN